MVGMQESGCPAHDTEAGVTVVKVYKSRELGVGPPRPSSAVPEASRSWIVAHALLLFGLRKPCDWVCAAEPFLLRLERTMS